jgi:cell division protein FtsL
MTNLLSSGWSLVKDKARLIIEYVLILIVIVLGVYGTVAYFRTKSLTTTTLSLSEKLGGLSGTLDQQVRANADQDRAIADLARLRRIDSQALEGLHNELDKADTKGDALRQKVRQLEKTNAAAKTLLDTAVPPALGCVLDGTPCPDAGGDKPDGGAAGPAR